MTIGTESRKYRSLARWVVPVAGISSLVLAGCATTETVYNTNRDAGTGSVVSRTSSRVINTIPVGQRPIGIVLNPARTFAYTANSGSNTVSVISTAGNNVVA